ncbi:MAG: aminopeptidase [Sulfuricaulis sp.]
MIYRLRRFAFALLLAALGGCAGPPYYVQAVQGEYEILAKRRPIGEVLADPATPPEIRHRLELVQRLRDFAERELHLPAEHSFRSYADLERPYVVWNVLATPELSLKPKRWCFVVAGCVPYRGYFKRAAAESFAAELEKKGDDVYVGGVPAYSTLGWFSDPVLNTFIDRPEADLAGLIFHELAHQKLYVSGDTAFNESFATAVQLEGVRRWYAHNGDAKAVEAYEDKMNRRDEFIRLLLRHRAQLAQVYASKRSDAEKRAAKAREFEALHRDYLALRKKWNGYAAFDGWFAGTPNNARLAAVGLYSQYVAAFQELLRQQHGDFAAFYRAVEKIARLPKAERDSTLRTLEQDTRVN